MFRRLTRWLLVAGVIVAMLFGWNFLSGNWPGQSPTVGSGPDVAVNETPVPAAPEPAVATEVTAPDDPQETERPQTAVARPQPTPTVEADNETANAMPTEPVVGASGVTSSPDPGPKDVEVSSAGQASGLAEEASTTSEASVRSDAAVVAEGSPEGEPDEALAALAPATSADARPTPEALSEDSGDASSDPAGSGVDTGAASEVQTPENDGISGDETSADIPRFDLVRVDRTGQMIIAGTAGPNEQVEIVLDGEVIGSAVTDAAGTFATVLATAPSGDARQLQLRTREPATTQAGLPEQAAEAGVGDAPPAANQSPSTQDGSASDTTPNVEGSVNVAGAGGEVNAQAEDEAGALGNLDAEPTPVTTVAAAPTQPVSDGTLAAVAPVAPSSPTVGAPTLRDRDPAIAAPNAVTAPTQSQNPGYKLSEPVLILPAAESDQAPAVVQPTEERLALVQPRGGEVRGVILDTLTYGANGNLEFSGRGREARAIRIYGNAAVLGVVPVAPDGGWTWTLAKAQAEAIQLFRFDEIDANGKVTSRIEAPFSYSDDTSTTQVLRDREVEIVRGDMLWRIAQRYYGEGIRYSLIFRANDNLIRDPDLIYPGQVFTVPELVDAE